MEHGYEDLKNIIRSFYEEGVTVPQAEKYAALFLHAQMQVAEGLQQADLDARMKKTGLKTIKAAVFLDGIKGQDKKPSDSLLTAKVDVNELVQSSQTTLDDAEVHRDLLKSYYDIFLNAHIFLRGVAKGNFGA